MQRRADLLMLDAAYARAIEHASTFEIQAALSQGVERAEEARRNEQHWRSRAVEIRAERDALAAELGVL